MQGIGYGLALVILGFLFMIPFSKAGKNFRRRSSGSKNVVMDPKALAEAERTVKEDRTPMVHVMTFNALDGYSEDFMVKAMLLLQTEGISAHYDTQMAPGSLAMRCWSVKCPPEQVAEAQALLHEKYLKP